ncbi:MAG: hypothetical protein CR992_00620 [Desulfobacterales bacterium]|nr:MAG: hypothetical protein CR992_00620 [Desulfobacterales bacterium]
MRDELESPADLYLEGSDQHRGWFQSSLLTSTGNRGRAPFKGVLTHGYVVDGKGKKMSKSVGNVVVPSEVIEKYGAEILRLWVSSEDYRDDIKVSDEILKQISDSYRKIRNTIRYFLGNIDDFDPAKHRVSADELLEIDKWALVKFEELREKITAAYEKYEFHAVYHGLNYFCGTTMSSFYLDILKDRLYTSGTDSILRRAAQTVLYDIVTGLLKLMSPILCFTANEAWDALTPGRNPLEKSIYFEEFPEPDAVVYDDAMMKKWEKLLVVRSEITKALELARREKIIGHSLEAEVMIKVDGDWSDFVEKEWDTIKEISIISELTAIEQEAVDAGITYNSEDIKGLVVQVSAAVGEKCSRCWTRSTTVGRDEKHPEICSRCSTVIADMGL